MASEKDLREAAQAALRYLERLDAAEAATDDVRRQVIARLRAALEGSVAPQRPTLPEPVTLPEEEEERYAIVRDALGPELLRLAERSNLSETFIVGRLVGARAPFTLTEVALECFGMPNKHERERIQLVVEALERAGLLTRLDPAGTRWSPPARTS